MMSACRMMYPDTHNDKSLTHMNINTASCFLGMISGLTKKIPCFLEEIKQRGVQNISSICKKFLWNNLSYIIVLLNNQDKMIFIVLLVLLATLVCTTLSMTKFVATGNSTKMKLRILMSIITFIKMKLRILM